MGRRRRIGTAWVGALLALVIGAFGAPARAQGDVQAFLATLSERDRATFEAYYAATTFHEAALDAYWAKVETLRAKRRQRIRSGGGARPGDYVREFPPSYEGPSLPADLRRRWAAFQSRDETPAKPREALPGLDSYLDAAERHYGFVPERVPERVFKERYASDALAAGLTKAQVVRVYALETSGLGTADMQAGIHPITRKGEPISSALGYAQLLAANSIGVLQQHGATFERRLKDLFDGTRDAQRGQVLRNKLNALRRMRATVARVGRNWNAHRAFARTSKGMGIHVLNIDGDIGPWLQVTKLKGVYGYAVKGGRPNLSPAELELMNLAGPATGLELMAYGLDVPTVNFFERRGYERNTIVRGKIGRELIAAIDKRMDENERNAGAIEFAEAFDRLIAPPPTPVRLR